MDNKSFIARLSRRLGMTPEEVTELSARTCSIFKETGCELDSIAIPGFGTFRTVKTDERIVTDSTDGSRTLLPPVISMEFQPSVVLRKKLNA